MIGKTLSGRYSIIQQLGGGGFSDTYLALDQQLPTTPRCVVKRLKSQSTDTAILKTVRRLFNVEATILYELGRKNDQIPCLLAHFEEDKEFYLVQEFIEGKDLSHELIHGRRLDEAEAIALLKDILDVLQFVHQQGVIHRDIKPRNLIRREEDRKIVLIDFGAVKQISTQIVNLQTEGQTSVTIAIGTPGYMPNEQQGGKPRFSSDIYAVGMVVVQALTGLSPYKLEDDPHTGEIMWRDLAEVSRGFADIVDKMVRTHFIDRYKSVEEVLLDLQQLQGATPEVSIPCDIVTPFPTVLHDFVTPMDAEQPKAKPIHAWQLPAFISRWAMVGLTLVSSLLGYGYWRFQVMPSSRATTAQLLPGQRSGSSQNLPQTTYNLTNTLTVHTGAVDAIAISPDGKTFVSGSEDNTVKLWDAQTGALLQSFSGHTAEVVAVAISRDGEMLATGSRDHTVRLWNLKTGALIHTLDHPDWVESVAFSPDGKMLVAGNHDSTVFVWDPKTGKLLCNFIGLAQSARSVAISPDGKLLAAGSEDKTIRVWSFETQKRVHILAQHTGTVEAVAMNPDGQTLITGGIDKILIWNLKTGQVVRTLPAQSALVRSLAVSSDGKILVSSHEDNTIKLWNLQTGELLHTLSGHKDWVLSVAVSPDGKTLISGSRDKAIKIWRL